MASAGSSSGAAAGDASSQQGDDPKDVDGGDSMSKQAKEAAIRDMPTPTGYRRGVVPAPSSKRSSIFDHGVQFEQDCTNPDEKKMKWSCACSPACRAASLKGEGAIMHNRGNTGNLTRHLKQVHGIVSGKTRKTQQNQKVHHKAVSAHQEAILKSPDPGRIMILMFVKVFMITHLLAFSLSDSSHVRLFFECCAHNMFPRSKLYPKNVKHYITEFYKATVSHFSHRLKSSAAGVGGAFLHANFDLWTSKTSNEKYIGLRLFWCTAAFVFDSALVAVKLFQPAADLIETTKLSHVLLIWVREVLKEFGLSTSDLFSTVTDAGSDVKRLCLKVMSSEWEWCFPHMLNCALLEAFGTNASKAACKNTAARAVIDAVKKVVEHLNKSNVMKVKYEDVQHFMFGNATKLVNAAPHRWISTCNVLEEVLRNWEALEKHCLVNETGGIFPLAVHKTAIEELYSLMKPVAVLIKDSQWSGGPTGLSTYIDLCVLRNTTLNVDKPLDITVPRKALVGQTGATTTTTPRAAASLQEVTTTTRKLLQDALLKRFFNKRYDEKVPASPDPGYVFEMAACMSPFFHKFDWLPKLCSSESEAQRIIKLVKKKVVDVMVSMAEGVGTAAEEKPDIDETAPSSKRKRKRPAGPFSCVSKKHDDAMVKRMAASGLFGDKSGEDDNDDDAGPPKLTLRDVCQQEFDRFQERFKEAKMKHYPLGALLKFWAVEGHLLYPNMARVARVLLSVPASSAVLERDFSTAGRLLTGSRSRLAGEYVEMTLFLNGNQEYIPIEVPSLSAQQAKEAIPRRLTNPTEEVAALSNGAEEVDNVGADEFSTEAEFCDV